MTFLAALRHDGMTAPFVLDGPIHGEAFVAYVAQVLVPTLSSADAGSRTLFAAVLLRRSQTNRPLH